MASVTIAAPGTKTGPCAEPCKHTDCQASRADAEARCYICGKAIGYERECFLGTKRIGTTGYMLYNAHTDCEAPHSISVSFSLVDLLKPGHGYELRISNALTGAVILHTTTRPDSGDILYTAADCLDVVAMYVEEFTR